MRIDRRVLCTRNALYDALVFLILEKDFEAISLDDILARANVGPQRPGLSFDIGFAKPRPPFELMPYRSSVLATRNPKDRLLALKPLRAADRRCTAML